MDAVLYSYLMIGGVISTVMGFFIFLLPPIVRYFHRKAEEDTARSLEILEDPADIQAAHEAMREVDEMLEYAEMAEQGIDPRQVSVLLVAMWLGWPLIHLFIQNQTKL